MNRLPLAATPFLLVFAGCNPHVVIEQPKPLEININFTGHLDLVIHDARQDMEQITGEKPINTVSPADIGLPSPPPSPPTTTSGAATPSLPRTVVSNDEAFVPVGFVQPRQMHAAPPSFHFVAVEDDLKKSLAARNPQIRELWDAKLVGEGHNGLVSARAALSADQQRLVDAENADRSALYAAEAKTKKSTPDEVALAYYVARLGYAKTGDWYEKRNAATGQWDWKQWGQ